jgi:hypothetical protein
MEVNNIIFPVTAERALSLRLEKVMAETGLSGYIYAQHLLRFEALLTARNSYKFNFYEQPGTDAPTEIKLKRQNAFFLTHIGIALYIAASDSVRPQSALQTWVDPFVFTGAGTNPELQQIYNGTLSLSTQPVQRIPPLSCNLFQYNPGRVQDADPPAVTAALGSSPWGPTLAQMGMRYMEPSVIVDGYEDNYVQLDIPGGSLTATGDDADVYVVVHAYGFNVDQGANRLGKYYLR